MSIFDISDNSTDCGVETCNEEAAFLQKVGDIVESNYQQTHAPTSSRSALDNNVKLHKHSSSDSIGGFETEKKLKEIICIANTSLLISFPAKRTNAKTRFDN